MSRTFIHSCVLALTITAAAAPAAAQLKATPFVSGLNGPVGFVQDPSDPTVQVVIEKRGYLWAVKNGVVQTPAFLNLSAPGTISTGGEQGLLGLAFAPDYATSRRFYVSYTNGQGHSVISRYLRDASNPLVADATTRFDFLWPGGNRFIIHPPFDGSVYGNHNGGNIAFGPDGYLYFGVGDGGSGNDPFHLAQNPQSLLGKMLRLDVSVNSGDAEGYDIPPTNPFVGNGGIFGEIWAFGLRNPWRWSFDWPRAGSTGALVIGDVGQGAWEEIDYTPMGVSGSNYGWRNREGAHNNVTTLPTFPIAVTDPIWELDRNAGRSITGGFVYRGNALGSAYRGRYFFADYITNRIWSLGLTIDPTTGAATVANSLEHTTELGAASGGISSFGVDAYGELFTVNYLTGTINRIETVANPAPGACASADPFVSSGGGACISGSWYARTRGTDFDGDHKADLLFENTSAQIFAWLMSGTSFAAGNFLTPGQLTATQLIVGSNDFSGDGKPDLLIQDQSSGALSFFLMNGLTRTSEVVWPIATNSPWRVAATGDFDGDTFADILWTHPATGQLYVWFMQPSGGQPGYGGSGGNFRGGFVLDSNLNPIALGMSSWRVAGAGDVNNDGRADLFWQNDASGDLGVWTMNGNVASLTSIMFPARASSAWAIRAVGDFNYDQHVDLVWRHRTTGDLYVWLMVGTRLAAGMPLSPSQVNPSWQIVAPR